MADDISQHLEEINKLAPAARARISDALKSSLAAELSTVAPGVAAAEFSKGAFFSRSRGTAGIDDQAIFDKAASMDQQAFTKFAQNLQTIKGLKGGTPG